MYLSFVIVAIAVLGSPIQMKTLNEVEQELTYLKKKIENLEINEKNMEKIFNAKLGKMESQFEAKLENYAKNIESQFEAKLENYAKNVESQFEAKLENCAKNVENKVQSLKIENLKYVEDIENGRKDQVNIFEKIGSIENDSKDQVNMFNKEAEMGESDFNSKKGNDTEDRLTYLEELNKMNLRRSCNEMAEYGVTMSNYYFVDPDGPLIGAEPVRVWCQFTDEGLAITEILHNSEEKIEVGHCHDPGCYIRPIVYTAPDQQIQSLIQLSENCEQSIRYDCLLAPLMKDNVEFGFWLDRNRDPQVYWDGAHFGQHVCRCYFVDEGCLEQGTTNTTCNCDAIAPELQADVGTIRNMSALPITQLQFGGLSYDLQQAYHQLGRLRCWGKASFDAGTSCTAIKKAGEFRSGFYNVKKTAETNSQLVFCNSSPGYDENDQNEQFVESSEDHFIKVETVISDIKTHITDVGDELSIVEDNMANLEKRSSYCGYRNHWNTGSTVITYDKLLLSDNNNIPSAQFDISSGQITVGMSGIYQVDVSMTIDSDGDYNDIYLRRNGVNIEESRMHSSIVTSELSYEGGGRSMLLRFNTGDIISVYVDRINRYGLYYTTFCIHLIK